MTLRVGIVEGAGVRVFPGVEETTAGENLRLRLVRPLALVGGFNENHLGRLQVPRFFYG